MLLIAIDYHNSIYGRCKYRSWQAGVPSSDEPLKLPCIDIIQVVCYASEYEHTVDVYLKRQDYDKHYDTETDTVIYAHRSLEDGMFTFGYNMMQEDKKAKLSELFNTVPYKFIAGLLLDSEEHTAGMVSPLLHEEHDVCWNKIHPSDLFENCFDGYSMVDITNLHTLNVSFNAISWLNLNRQQVKWLEMTGMRYFPMLIHPFRIDKIDIHVRWEQPTEYPEYNLKLWEDTKIPNGNRCGCGHYKIENYKQPSPLQMSIIKEHVVRTEMKLFYHNQNRRAKGSAYTNNGVGRFHGYLSNEFATRATKLLIKEGLHLTAKQ